ncbi:hypothetical protein KP509_02G017200 [Ceratopteris richardii]|uniref:Uncharacterized protein n=1 Tax=Ceratopteris richardii TaxID=49495 RepID=A0A8T2V3N0_CERRI|nr:hypothetical protein KP509_02G017200 [Ceratopteris richardii]
MQKKAVKQREGQQAREGSRRGKKVEAAQRQHRLKTETTRGKGVSSRFLADHTLESLSQMEGDSYRRASEGRTCSKRMENHEGNSLLSDGRVATREHAWQEITFDHRYLH